MGQTRLQRCRSFLPAQGPPDQPSGPSGSSTPHITMSPRTPTDLPTTGIMFMVTAALQLAQPIRVYKREPVSQIWAILATITGTDAVTFKWISICGLNASELWFDVDQPTAVIYLEETSGGGA